MIFFTSLFWFVLDSYRKLRDLIDSFEQRVKIELITFLFFTVGYGPTTIVLDPQWLIEGGPDPPIDGYQGESDNTPQSHPDH